MIQGALVYVAASVGQFEHEDIQALAGNGLVLAIVTMATAPVMVALCVAFAKLRRNYPLAEYLGLKVPSRRQTIRWVILFVVFVGGSDGLTLLMGRSIVPDFMVHAMETAVFPPLLWVAVVIAAPVSEEFYFRGFLLKGLLHSRLGATGAVIVTAGLWALIHQQYDLWQIAWIFAAGLLLGSLRVTTNSLLLCICIHSLMNLIATVQGAIYVAMR
jgi:membrane protease YdiL (CAAX protease family)